MKQQSKKNKLSVKSLVNAGLNDDKRDNRVTLIVVIIVLFIVPFALKYRSDKLKNYNTAIGIVTMHTRTVGDRVGQPEIVCKVLIDGKERLINYETKNLDVQVGDCVEIKYSVENPKINELNYEKGKIPCQ